MPSELPGEKEQVVVIEYAYFDQVDEFVVGDIRFVISDDDKLL